MAHLWPLYAEPFRARRLPFTACGGFFSHNPANLPARNQQPASAQPQRSKASLLVTPSASQHRLLHLGDCGDTACLLIVHRSPAQASSPAMVVQRFSSVARVQNDQIARAVQLA